MKRRKENKNRKKEETPRDPVAAWLRQRERFETGGYSIAAAVVATEQARAAFENGGA